MIHHGDLFDVLPTLDASSIDACVTDPPYGIGFMGKQWDTFNPEAGLRRIVPNTAKDSANPNLKGRTRGPASSPSAVEYDRTLQGQRAFQTWTEQWAREVYRVLKPGAHLLVCGAPRSFHRMTCGIEDAGFVVRDCLSWLYGQGFPKSLNLGDGRGTALKPGWEPIVLARKPVTTTIVASLLAHGTGALNIDACRVPGDSGEQDDPGRWPGNVLLDEDAAAMVDATIPVSRFFYVAKPSNGERDYGCDRLPTKSPMELTGRKAGSAGLQHARAGTDRAASNYHPTVKPIELMRWLVRLITPLDGTVLDPFTGSGTTGMACRYELRRFVGVEREAEYITIAEARIRAVAPLFAETS